jgi:hypothetical protein
MTDKTDEAFNLLASKLDLEPMEDEFKAITAVVEALGDMAPESATRICAYVISRLKAKRDLKMATEVLSGMAKEAIKKKKDRDPFGFNTNHSMPFDGYPTAARTV